MSSEEGICLACSEQGPISVCSRCKKAEYCSITCQKRDWKNHKPNCKPKKNPGSCSCPICGKDGLEKECPFICLKCGVSVLHCEMCMFDKRVVPIEERNWRCIDCSRGLDNVSFTKGLCRLKAALRPEDAGPLENTLRLGYTTLNRGPGGHFQVDMEEVIRLADEVKYAPAMYVLGALYMGLNEPCDSRTQLGKEAERCFMLGAWTKGFNNDYTLCDTDIPRAKKYLKHAADLDYAPAMYMLGTLYVCEGSEFSGLVEMDGDSFTMYRRAANMGHADAAIGLAGFLGGFNNAERDAGDREEAIWLLKRLTRKGRPGLAENARRVMDIMLGNN